MNLLDGCNTSCQSIRRRTKGDQRKKKKHQTNVGPTKAKWPHAFRSIRGGQWGNLKTRLNTTTLAGHKPDKPKVKKPGKKSHGGKTDWTTQGAITTPTIHFSGGYRNSPSTSWGGEEKENQETWISAAGKKDTSSNSTP